MNNVDPLGLETEGYPYKHKKCPCEDRNKRSENEGTPRSSSSSTSTGSYNNWFSSWSQSQGAFDINAPVVSSGSGETPYERMQRLMKAQGIEMGDKSASGKRGNTSLDFLGEAEHTDAFDGFWGKARYFFFGPNVGNTRYDMDGNYQGPAFVTGIAPTPGFKGGSIFIKGLGNVEKGLFHTVTKPDILKASGNFWKMVGGNPDITVKDGLIILRGTGPFKGKVFETGLEALDFFGF